MKIILAPVDFSSATPAVLAETATLAKALSARVVLFTVVQPPVMIAEYGMLMENVVEITDAGEKAAAKHLVRLREQLERRSIPTRVMQASGSPGKLIVETAAELKASYIVMGSHGHTAFYDLIVGGTTHGVLRRASCPVIVVPPTAMKKPGKKSL